MAATHPEHANASARPAAATPTPRPPHPLQREDRCPVVSKRPLHSRAPAKMSPHIRIGPEPVLTAHVPSPPAAGSHCPTREERFSSPLRNRISFYKRGTGRYRSEDSIPSKSSRPVAKVSTLFTSLAASTLKMLKLAPLFASYTT